MVPLTHSKENNVSRIYYTTGGLTDDAFDFEQMKLQQKLIWQFLLFVDLNSRQWHNVTTSEPSTEYSLDICYSQYLTR